ncbi:NDT80 / PhoG like DNA-binding family protein [Ascosphaera apis ARSEF 7405]|uniref:NDT80 / PhoG like DNA-binding family protein n=1 Tax=Ascosphaera apis ARSEF 7405 TaxID=392613 RepID=A0A167Z0A3_9EURO|nr:NDT80 / PhoG like DNA-binding family protein [Ascosphaera apis ARSEF 7405]
MSLTPTSEPSPEMMSTPNSAQSIYQEPSMVDPQMYPGDNFESPSTFSPYSSTKLSGYKGSDFPSAPISHNMASHFPSAALSGAGGLPLHNFTSSYPTTMYGIPSRDTYYHPSESLNMFYDHMASSAQESQGPPFRDTIIERPLIAGGAGLKLDISARATRNFFPLGDKWGCYRRNYISLSCSFSIAPMHYPQEFYVNDDSGNPAKIRSFAFGISGVVNDNDEEIRELVMHGPKRDKASERKPPKVIVKPGPSGMVPSHFPTHSQHGMARMDDMEFLTPEGVEQPSQPPYNHTFERIQFVKATANNGKRRATQQYYNLVVTLYADVNSKGAPNWVPIAKRKSEPIIPRTTYDSLGAVPNYYSREESRHMCLPPPSPYHSPFQTHEQSGMKRRLSASLMPSARCLFLLFAIHQEALNSLGFTVFIVST